MAVGYMYEYGYGVTKSEYDAIKWYEKAALQGHEEAQYNLANIYQYGKGVPVDKIKARKWFEVAAAKGNKNAIIVLENLDKTSKKKVKKQTKVYKTSKSIDYGRFIDKGEYVKDTKTGLLWQKNGRQSGQLNFYQAQEYAKNLNLGGFKNWRVPTSDELESIFPALEKPFVNTPYTDKKCCEGPYEWRGYWTSEMDYDLEDYAYIYEWHGDGGKNNCYASRNYDYVRCVHD